VKTILQLSKKFLIFLVFLNISFNVYADPDPDSIRIAKRVSIAMQEFYAIQAQNAWNDANRLSENNIYVFGLGEFLENPEDDYLWMPEGAQDVLDATGAIRNEVITELKSNLKEYNTYFQDNKEPYEIWVYLSPILVGLEGEWQGGSNNNGYNFFFSSEALKAKVKYGEMDIQEMYEALEAHYINIEEAELFEHKVYSQILKEIEASSKSGTKKIIYFQSNYISMTAFPDANSNDPSNVELKTYTFKSISTGGLQKSEPQFLQGVEEDKNKLIDLLPKNYKKQEKFLLVYPPVIYADLYRTFLKRGDIFDNSSMEMDEGFYRFSNTEINNQARYKSSFSGELFKLAFSHPFPKELIDYYTSNKGGTFTLTEEQMMEITPVGGESITDDGNFREVFNKLDIEESLVTEFRTLSSAMLAGTLGDFTIVYQGTLTRTGEEDFEFNGDMTFNDTYDFNKSEHRTDAAEWKVWVARNFLHGTPYLVTSEAIPVSENTQETRLSSEIDWFKNTEFNNYIRDRDSKNGD